MVELGCVDVGGDGDGPGKRDSVDRDVAVVVEERCHLEMLPGSRDPELGRIEEKCEKDKTGMIR